jgi:hypothetical protein
MWGRYPHRHIDTSPHSFLQVTEYTPTVNLLFMANNVLSINSKEANSGEELLLNSYYSFKSISFKLNC